MTVFQLNVGFARYFEYIVGWVEDHSISIVGDTRVFSHLYQETDWAIYFLGKGEDQHMNEWIDRFLNINAAIN